MRTILMVILLSVILIKCAKPDLSYNATKGLVKAFKDRDSSCTYECIYDEQNRLLAVEGCGIKETFEYFNDSVIYNNYKQGRFLYQYSYYLNDKGLADRFVRYDQGTVSRNYEFVLNQENFRLKFSEIGIDTGFKTYDIANQNIVREYNNKNTPDEFVIEMYYDQTKLNSLSYRHFGRYFMGSSSKNLKTREVWRTRSGDFFRTYSYKLDDKGFVLQRVIVLNGRDTTENRTYAYE
jgi:hypothetical protein